MKQIFQLLLALAFLCAPSAAQNDVKVIEDWLAGSDREFGKGDAQARNILREMAHSAQAAEFISRQYVGEADPLKLLQAASSRAKATDFRSSRHLALKAMVGQLDRYSYFDTPEERLATHKYWVGSPASTGLAAAPKKKGEPFVVVGVFPGSPADRAGIQPGDGIVEINSRSTLPSDEEDRTIWPQGKIGDRLAVKVRQRAGRAEREIQRVLVLEEIRHADLFHRSLGGGVGYIQIRHFEPDTPGHFQAAMKALSQGGMRKLVIDLRQNPGGKVGPTLQIVTQFMRRDETLVSLCRKNSAPDTFCSPGGGAYRDLPLAVLVDERSMSGSEAFAGALQDHGRAVIVGAATYGKGSMQENWEFKDGSGLTLTTGRWKTPKGTCVDRGFGGCGIQPDIPVRLSEDQKTEVLRRLYKQIANQKAEADLDPVLAAAIQALGK